MAIEERTARLTLLIDPNKKEILEHLCAREDKTPSQVVRQLIRDYIEQRLGRPWKPGETVKETLKELDRGRVSNTQLRDIGPKAE